MNHESSCICSRAVYLSVALFFSIIFFQTEIVCIQRTMILLSCKHVNLVVFRVKISLAGLNHLIITCKTFHCIYKQENCKFLTTETDLFYFIKSQEGCPLDGIMDA